METFTSKLIELNTISFPEFTGDQVYMLGFNTTKDINKLPIKYREIINKMLKPFEGISINAHLTIDERFVKKSSTHRRGGAHIDGNYVQDSWGSGGWLTSNHFNPKSKDMHKLLYETPKGGIIIASNYSACKAWEGTFRNDIKQGGDVSHLTKELSENQSRILNPNTIYLGNSQMVHESIPVLQDVHRQLIRITLDKEFKFL